MTTRIVVGINEDLSGAISEEIRVWAYTEIK